MSVILKMVKGSMSKTVQLKDTSSALSRSVRDCTITADKYSATAGDKFDYISVEKEGGVVYLVNPDILVLSCFDETEWVGEIKEDNTPVIETVVTSEGYTLRLGHSLNNVYSEHLPGKGASYHQSSGGWGKKITKFIECERGVEVYAEGDVLVGKIFNNRALIYKC